MEVCVHVLTSSSNDCRRETIDLSQGVQATYPLRVVLPEAAGEVAPDGVMTVAAQVDGEPLAQTRGLFVDFEACGLKSKTCRVGGSMSSLRC